MTGVSVSDFTYTYADAYAITDVYAGVGLQAVPNLTAWIEYQASLVNYSATANASYAAFDAAWSKSLYANGNNLAKHTVTETLTCNLKEVSGWSPVSAGLVAYEFFYGSDWATDGTNKTPLNASFRLTPWVSYTFDGGVAPKLGLTYFAGAEALQSGSGYNYTYALGNKPSLVKTNSNNAAVLEVKPAVAVPLGTLGTLTLAVAYYVSVGADDVVFLADSGVTSPTSIYTLQANYLAKF